MVAFSGGDKLEAYLRDMSAKVTKSAQVEIGFRDDRSYPNGQPVALVAAIQEFGAPGKGIPPRPFFRTMIKNNSDSWGPTLAALLEANDYDSEKALGLIGEQIAGELRQSIIDLNAPALSAVTIMLRGMKRQAKYRDMPFGALIKEAIARVKSGKTSYSGTSTKPLEDTFLMLESITSTVTAK